MRVLIGSPTADGEVEPIFAQSVMRLVGHFLGKHRDVEFEIDMPPGRSVAWSRDLLANRVLCDESFTHLLFIDTDMGFPPELIERMFAADLPFVGTIAPQRHRDLDAWRRAIGQIPHPLLAEFVAADYTPALSEIDTSEQATAASRHGLLKARRTGAGIVLLRREVFETMAERCPDLHESEPRPELAEMGVDRPLVRFFKYHRDVFSGVLNGEDLSFSWRWTTYCDGEIWLVADATILHVGSRVVTGDYAHRMTLEARREPASIDG